MFPYRKEGMIDMRLTSNKRGLANRFAREFVRGVNNSNRRTEYNSGVKQDSGLWFVAGIAIFLMLCSIFGGLIYQ
jgi:hypothetical protein